MHTVLTTSTTATTLPVHPRRAGWRAGAAASLVAFAVSELRSGRSPHRDVAALAQLGGGDLPYGLAAAEELDRRLDAALAHLVADLQVQRARASAFDGPGAASAPQGDDVAGALVTTLFDRLGDDAVTGCPHPGEWVASSVDVVPCALHGYEDGPVDCLRLLVRAHLGAVLDRATGPRPSSGAPTLGEQVRAAAAEDTGLAGNPVLRALWTGVAAMAAWQAYASTV